MKMYKQQLKDVNNISQAIDFDDLYDEISHDWKERAVRLQERRWRKLEAFKDNSF